MVEPLRELTRKGSSFDWTSKQEQSFDDVKRALCKQPVLQIFDERLKTIISTDASGHGIGATLTQKTINTEVTIAFASRTLSATERNYSTIEREALACVWAVERFRQYVWGRNFVLRTDHKPLIFLLNSKGIGKASARVDRWISRLLSYNYDCEYRSGKENIVPDFLSRNPCKDEADSEEILLDDENIVATVVEDLQAISIDEYKKAVGVCDECIKVKQMIEEGWKNVGNKISNEILPYYKCRGELAYVDGLIMKGAYRLIVPRSLREKILKLAHEQHPGIVRSKQRLRELYWWPGMDKQMEDLVKSCVICNQNDKTVKTFQAPMQPVDFPKEPWKKLGIDIIGPFDKLPSKYRFGVTLVDYHSKWPEVAFMPEVSTHRIIKFLKTIFGREGSCHELVSDNGVQFRSFEFARFLKSENVRHLRTSLYYPQSNGEVERFNRTLKHVVERVITEKFGDVAQEVSQFLRIYRSTIHATTGKSPSELLHGRCMKTKLNIGLSKVLGEILTKQLYRRE